MDARSLDMAVNAKQPLTFGEKGAVPAMAGPAAHEDELCERRRAVCSWRIPGENHHDRFQTPAGEEIRRCKTTGSLDAHHRLGFRLSA